MDRDSKERVKRTLAPRLKTRSSLLERWDVAIVPNLSPRCTSQETTLVEAHELQTSSVASITSRDNEEDERKREKREKDRETILASGMVRKISRKNRLQNLHFERSVFLRLEKVYWLIRAQYKGKRKKNNNNNTLSFSILRTGCKRKKNRRWTSRKK